MTLTEYTSNQNFSSTINLATDGLLRGVGSKQITITSSANPIISVSVDPNNYDDIKSPTIENLVIVGNGSNIGILLQNVHFCKIRNVTIVNCDTGVKLTATSGGWTELTHIEHVRMKDVYIGVKFVGAYSFGFTYINDVGISLKDAQYGAGIEIGTNSNIYGSFIKANVWSVQEGRGMYIDGGVTFCLININHEKTTSGAAGSGIYLGQNAYVWDASIPYGQGDVNQSIFVAAGNLTEAVTANGKQNNIQYRTY